MPWPLELHLIDGRGRGLDGTVHRVTYTAAGNYMFSCGAVVAEMEVDGVLITLVAVSHHAMRKVLVPDNVDCIECLDLESRGLLEV